MSYATGVGSIPALLANINIALSSKYWIVGIVIANTLSIAMTKSFESYSKETQELIVMKMFTAFALLVLVASRS